ncbi:MAG: aminopeptidase P family protein [Oscillospiraceae bacterium]|nr:aminopeptidase P family protein [Oscillospiraceae bacterium]MBQ7130701.1 aminopeptidase P family protein [Oscillospiraceae bacterium]
MKNLDKYLSLLNNEVNGLLLTSRYARHYGAEFDIAEGVAIVSKKGCRYFTDSRYIESAEKGIQGFEVLPINQFTGFVKRINDAIEDFGITTLGFEEKYLSVEELMGYERELHAKLVPFNKEIYGFRGIKEEWELDLMRKAQEITDKAFSEVITRIKPGMTELQLQAELIYCLYKNGGQGLSFDPIVVSGPNTSLPHGVAGERVIQEGDFVTMDFGCLYHGYCSDMTRTVAVGYATEEMKTVYSTVLAAQLAGIAVTKAGTIGRDIDAAARKVITDAGYGQYFGHGYGHSLGLEVHEGPNPNPGNANPMPAGAVCSAEPGIYIPGKFGVRIEDVTIVKEDGCEIITGSPKNLIIV